MMFYDFVVSLLISILGSILGTLILRLLRWQRRASHVADS